MFKLRSIICIALFFIISSHIALCEENEDYLDQYILQDLEIDGDKYFNGQTKENAPGSSVNERTEIKINKNGKDFFKNTGSEHQLLNKNPIENDRQNLNKPDKNYMIINSALENAQIFPDLEHLGHEELEEKIVLTPIKDGTLFSDKKAFNDDCQNRNILSNSDVVEFEGEKVVVRKTRSNNADNSSSSSPEPLISSTTSKDIGNVSTSAPNEVLLPDKHGIEEEHKKSMSIFFVLCVLALSILLIHLMLQTNFQWLPESVVIVLLGALIGLILNLMSNQNIANWTKEEAFSPSAFFLVLLPPIIFESGYNLHKGNFFQNIGSILVFAIFGTAISAFVIGAGIYLLGLAKVAYKLSFVESFVFGSLISAVDPVATVAIFHALDVDPVLNMLVFGESILNDAIAIVLTTSILEANNPNMSSSEAILTGINRFCLMFFASAAIGVAFALVSALLLKHMDFRKNPSLEFGIMLVFTYAPYALAEGMHLSGIMAILFCGIGMSHYTHFNLSTVTQITMQQTMRTLAFIAETCVFAYLGLALFSFRHRLEPALVVWSFVLCLLGRACNIFPLAILVNRFREHKITHRMMFIMWFSGLRGAISYALSLHLDFSDDTRHVIITTTLIIVLITTLFLGGSTMPLMKCLQADKKGRSRRKRRDKEITLSKTLGWGQTIDSEHLSQTEEELEVNFFQSRIKGFAKLDYKYFIPFFTRRFTQQELGECKSQMTDLTDQWYQAVRVSPNDSELEEIASSPKPKSGAKL